MTFLISESDATKFLYSSPPVLGCENLKAYDAIRRALWSSVKPRDFIEEIFVKDLVNLVWEDMRYSRVKTVAVERQRQMRLDAVAVLAERNKNKQATKEWRQEVNAEAQKTLTDREHHLEESAEELASEINYILTDPSVEFEYQRAFSVVMSTYVNLDRLQGISFDRRNQILQLLEQHREGFRRTMNNERPALIDADLPSEGATNSDVAPPGAALEEAPSVVPPEN